MNLPTQIAELTAKQHAIINLPLETKCLITGGAGTGKTLVLIHRLAKLVNTDNLGPGSEILVLSFSRNAVTEIRRRLQAFGGAVAYVRVRTFDSFATRLLNLFVPSEHWIDKDYDQRIRLATTLCRRPEPKVELTRYRHVVVDELQDLVGDRADLVRAVLESTVCGFTTLGDPAQGIYNFQLEGVGRRIGSAEWLRKRFGSQLNERSLNDNFRAKSTTAKAALWAGDELNSATPDYQSIRNRLDETVRNLKSLGDVPAAALSVDLRSTTNAILCRTNGQALTISGELNSLGIKHVLQTGATDRIIARWVSILLRSVETSRIGKARLLRIAQETTGESVPEPMECWKILKRSERGSGIDLDLDTLANRIRCGDMPDDLTQVPIANLIVSTIHKSKGLEFDCVLLVEPDAGPVEGTGDEDFSETLPEETRLLYVALTRTRNGLFHVNRPETRRLRKHASTKRWVLKGFKYWQTRAVEVRGEDVHYLDPAGTFVISHEPVKLQEYIRAAVNPGDPVTLNRKFHHVEGQRRTFYVVEHDGRSVGITSDRFAAELFGILNINAGWEVMWPAQITKLRVQAIDSVAGVRSESLVPGFSNGNVWLRVRVVGLGDLVFD
jgi:superfamily I DNA/RNA helicase